jgi:hypothetical protein
VAIRPPTPLPFSKSVTSCPDSANRQAQTQPDIPAPTIIIFISQILQKMYFTLLLLTKNIEIKLNIFLISSNLIK